jgi:hypothetical protein
MIARFQPPLKAGATQERTLEAVGCKPLFGQDFHLSMGCLASQTPYIEK